MSLPLLMTLHDSTGRGYAEAADLLLSAGAEPDHQESRMGATALHFAASGGHLDVARVLLESGADPGSSIPGKGWTALHHAATSTSKG